MWLKEHRENIEIFYIINILGTIVKSDLEWNENSEYLIKKAWKKMQLLTNAAEFTREKKDLKIIYTTCIRPVFEQSAPVWCISFTEENSTDLERVKKTVIKIIMCKY